MNNGKGIRVTGCPIKQDYCFPSCYFHKDSRCHFISRQGKRMVELKEEKEYYFCFADSLFPVKSQLPATQILASSPDYEE